STTCATPRNAFRVMNRVFIETIAAELKARPQWELWRYEQRGGKRTKGPYQTNGARAARNDPTTWTTFDAAVARLAPGGDAGLGFVFSPSDPYAGIDLDKCRDATTGAIAPWAHGIVDALDSCSEVTPSGTGLHILVQGALPPGGRRRGQIEMYDQGRF